MMNELGTREACLAADRHDPLAPLRDQFALEAADANPPPDEEPAPAEPAPVDPAPVDPAPEAVPADPPQPR